jgi:hypothetical protein
MNSVAPQTLGLISLKVVYGCHSVYGVNTPEHLIKRQITRQPPRRRHLSRLGFEPFGKRQKGFANGKGREAD